MESLENLMTSLCWVRVLVEANHEVAYRFGARGVEQWSKMQAVVRENRDMVKWRSESQWTLVCIG